MPSAEKASQESRPNTARISSQGHCLIDRDCGKIVAAEAQVASWLGLTPPQCDDRLLADLVPILTKEYLEKLEISAGNASFAVNTSVQNHEGSSFQAAIEITPLSGSQQTHLLVTICPIGSPNEYSFRCDALTGLPDRRELSAHRSRWQQSSSGRPIPHALLFLDLDKFKQINDLHGHAVGDRILTTLASRWLRCIRENDLLVRYGGDEFVILLAGIREQCEIEPIANRLLAAASEPIAIDDQLLSVGATIGIALAEDISFDLDKLIVIADRDMYQKKRQPEVGN